MTTHTVLVNSEEWKVYHRPKTLQECLLTGSEKESVCLPEVMGSHKVDYVRSDMSLLEVVEWTGVNRGSDKKSSY